MDRDCGIRVVFGIELERVQVCHYRAGVATDSLDLPCLAATGRGFEWILESPPLSVALALRRL